MRIKNLHLDLILLIALLVLCNLHLFSGVSPATVTFLPAAAADGEWWRIVTHAFAHVSWYHLLIDASAFVLLYTCLREKTIWKKLAYVAACIAGSLLFSLLFKPIYSYGLCGLSGAAHGLLAVVACELIVSKFRTDKTIGLICLGILISKTLIELFTGNAFFSSLHFGNIGTPIVECHTGGIIGGITLFIIFHLSQIKKAAIQSSTKM